MRRLQHCRPHTTQAYIPANPNLSTHSLGNIGFAFGTAIVLLEVQDTLREPPAAAVSMKKTVNTA